MTSYEPKMQDVAETKNQTKTHDKTTHPC